MFSSHPHQLFLKKKQFSNIFFFFNFFFKLPSSSAFTQKNYPIFLPITIPSSPASLCSNSLSFLSNSSSSSSDISCYRQSSTSFFQQTTVWSFSLDPQLPSQSSLAVRLKWHRSERGHKCGGCVPIIPLMICSPTSVNSLMDTRWFWLWSNFLKISSKFFFVWFFFLFLLTAIKAIIIASTSWWLWKLSKLNMNPHLLSWMPLTTGKGGPDLLVSWIIDQNTSECSWIIEHSLHWSHIRLSPKFVI